MSILGFTGSQKGMTAPQLAELSRLIRAHWPRPTEFHHGDCVGADAQAHDIIRGLLPGCRVIIHPPKDQTRRAFKLGDVVLPEDEFLARNEAIAEACTTLIATPAQDHEVLRSGTWSTVRRARTHHRELRIILPTGFLHWESAS